MSFLTVVFIVAATETSVSPGATEYSGPTKQ